MPLAVPGMIDVEKFDKGGPNVSYHDDTPGYLGGVARDTDVDLQSTPDGRYALAWLSPCD